MTAIRVRKVDIRSPGSTGDWRRAGRVVRAQQAIAETNSATAAFEIVELLHDYLAAVGETDDGTPIREALDELSVSDLMDLFNGSMGADPVDPQNGEPSIASRLVERSISPIGSRISLWPSNGESTLPTLSDEPRRNGSSDGVSSRTLAKTPAGSIASGQP